MLSSKHILERSYFHKLGKCKIIEHVSIWTYFGCFVSVGILIFTNEFYETKIIILYYKLYNNSVFHYCNLY